MAFDIADYKRRSGRLVIDDLDFGEFRTAPLDEDTLRCIRYMHDVEYHTVCYLRDLLLTPAHTDPEVTSFLSFWAFEEYWHGEALAAVLAAHGEPNGDVRVAALRSRLGFRDHLRPLLSSLGGSFAGRDFTAVHMTWGAINEWVTQASYGLLARQAGNPLLSRLLGRIMRQEGRHIDFYSSQARWRLETSVRARRLTRFALRRFWRPVGAGVMPPSDTQFLGVYLMGNSDGQHSAERIDRRIDRLPGLEGLHLVSSAVEKSLVALAS